MQTTTLDGRITALAARQHGAVTIAQVKRLGGSSDLPRRRVTAEHWSRAAPGVFVVGGAPATAKQQIMVAVFAAGPGAVVSHRTAAWLRGLITRKPDLIDITISYSRNHRRAGVRIHRSRDLDRAEVVQIDGIPVTGAARTLLDLGAVAPNQVRSATWAALRNGSTAWNVLLRSLIRHSQPGRAGIGPLRDLVAEHYGDLASDSTTEDLAFQILADSGRVPLPDRQVKVMCADGVEVTVDFGWPDHRALLEVFGVDHLTNEDLQHLDLHRRNQIELAGNHLLVYSGRLLRR